MGKLPSPLLAQRSWTTASLVPESSSPHTRGRRLPRRGVRVDSALEVRGVRGRIQEGVQRDVVPRALRRLFREHAARAGRVPVLTRLKA